MSSLDIGDALREGARRLGTPGGLQLLAALVVVGLANTVAVQSFWPAYAEVLQGTGAELPAGFPPPTPLGLEVGLGSVLASMFVLALVGEAVRIAGVRGMVREETSTIPLSLATRRLGWAVLNGFVGGIVVSVLVLLGAIALLVPGIYLGVALFFVRQEIAVEDCNFLDAIERSWELTRGARLEVFVLWLVFAGLSFGFVFVPSSVLSALLGQGSPVAPVATSVLGAVAATYGVATTSRAYVQLTGGRDEGEAGSTTDDGEEWPDPPGVDV